MKKIHLLSKVISHPFYFKTKFLQSLLLVVFLNHSFLKAEVQSEVPRTINYPSRNDWKEYFNDHLKKVKAKLYNAALEGKIKAYYSDSFTGTLSNDELLKPQAAVLSVLPGNANADPSQATNKTEIIKGIEFIQTINTSPFEFNTRQKMDGVILLIDFFGMNFPFAYFKTDDLKLILSSDDLTFLSLLSYHGLHGNGQWVRPGFDNSKEDAFIHLYYSGTTRFCADTTLITKMASMLYLTNEFIKMTVVCHKDDNLFTDLLTGKPISHQAICDIYDNTYYFFSEENDYSINSITIKADKTPQFNILIPLDVTRGPLREIKFTLSFKALEDKGLMPVHTWFFTDYLKWKAG